MPHAPMIARIPYGYDEMRVYAGICCRSDNTKRFSVTASIYSTSGRCIASGTMHEEIIQRRPDLAPLVRMHLSDWNGVPQHAKSDGWYWLVGAAAGAIHFRPNGGEQARPGICLGELAGLLRVSISKAQGLVVAAIAEAEVATADAACKSFGIWVEMQAPRWAEEADLVRQHYDLQEF